MKFKLISVWLAVRSSFWFLPSLCSAAAVVLAAISATLDASFQTGKIPLHLYFPFTDAAGARAVLSTIAASSITVAGVVFSITIAVLANMSAQLGPRLITNFMKENSTQVVLGGFIGTFIYCLIILSMVRSHSGHVFIPQISVSLGLLLGIFSFVLLIHFISTVSTFIQTSHVLDDVTGDLLNTFRRLFPEPSTETGRAPDDEPSSIADSFETDGVPIKSATNGYIQAIDIEALLRLAVERDLTVLLLRRPGQFIVHGEDIARVKPAQSMDDTTCRALQRTIVTGSVRTTVQDAEFAIDQLVEVALRALSPGINDAFTAISCIDRLRVALSMLAERRLPSRFRYDSEGRLRVVTEPYTYSGILDAAFNQLRQNARGQAAVMIHLMGAIALLARREVPKAYREALGLHAQMIHDEAHDSFSQQRDRQDFNDRFTVARESLQPEHGASNEAKNDLPLVRS